MAKGRSKSENGTNDSKDAYDSNQDDEKEDAHPRGTIETNVTEAECDSALTNVNGNGQDTFDPMSKRQQQGGNERNDGGKMQEIPCENELNDRRVGDGDCVDDSHVDETADDGYDDEKLDDSRDTENGHEKVNSKSQDIHETPCESEAENDPLTLDQPPNGDDKSDDDHIKEKKIMKTKKKKKPINYNVDYPHDNDPLPSLKTPFEPRPSDVLFGRGGLTNKNPGKWRRDIIFGIYLLSSNSCIPNFHLLSKVTKFSVD